MTVSSNQVVPLRPERIPYLTSRILPPLAVAVVVGLAGLVVSVVVEEALIAVVTASLTLLMVVPAILSAFVAYGKESYELHPSFIRATRGGLFSEQVTELDVRNITHVKQRLHWLRWRVFGVGDLLVESAGSAASEVHMLAMRDPDRLYDELRSVMRRNGYALGYGRVLHRAEPAKIGVAIELIGVAFGGAMALFFTLGGGLADRGSASLSEADLTQSVLTLFTVLGAITAVAGLAGLVFRGLDLLRRTYTVYDDVVVYEEGFLTRNNAFIPYENVADAEAKRTLVDQIFGLTNVKVSCQGGSSEVLFKYLSDGDALMAAVSSLVESARNAKRTQAPSAASDITAPLAGVAAAPRADLSAELVPPEQAWTTELRMNMGRAVLGVVPLFLFPPAALVAAVGAALRASATTYSVRRSSVRSAFKLLSVDEREFAYDKITGLVVEENIFDRLTGTVSIVFWSIGSPLPLEMRHLDRAAVDLDALRRQVGIPPPSPSPRICTTSFGLGAWLRANVGRALDVLPVLLGVVALAAFVHPALAALVSLPLVFAGAHYVYRTFYYAVQRVELHERHLFAQTGRLIQRRYYARYANIKKVQRTLYPGGDEGSLTIFVAGEQIPALAQGNRNAKDNPGVRVPYAFQAHYLDDVEQVAELVDDVMRGRVVPGPRAVPAATGSTLHTAQPAVSNGLAKLCLLSLLTVVGVPLLPITVPWVVVYLRRKRYLAEDARVAIEWGILYRSRASILYDRMDSLQQSQGLLGKIFGNGNVTVLTAGSSNPDLTLTDLPEHKAFYDVVRRHYAAH